MVFERGVSQWFQSVFVDCLTDLNCPNFVEVITGMNTVKQFVVQEPGLFPIRYLGLYNSSCKAWGVHSIKGIEFADAPVDLYHCSRHASATSSTVKFVVQDDSNADCH